MHLRMGPQPSTVITEKDIKPWLRLPPRSYLLTNANVVNVVDGSVLKHGAVKLQGGKITMICPVSACITLEAEATGCSIIDCKDNYLIPGLIDSHVHINAVAGSSSFLDSLKNVGPNSLLRQPYVCQQMLHRGFTTIRDCGGTFLPLKEAIADGVIPGPRLIIAGSVLSQTGGHGDLRSAHDHSPCCGTAHSLGRICNGVPDCLAAVRENMRTGSDFIKIMAGGGVASPTDHIQQLQFTPDEMRAITAAATDAGTYVTAHAYTPAAIKRCIAAGVRGIEHGNLLDGPTAALMAQHGVFLTPTLVTYDQMASDKWATQLPPSTREKNLQVLDAGLRAVTIAAEAGVTLCFGTDLLGPLGVAQTREFAIRKQVLSPLEILRSATVNAAQMNRVEDCLGQIREGFEADLVLVRGNPLEDIEVLDDPAHSVLLVVKEGRIYRSQLDGCLADADIPLVLKG